MVLSVDNCNGGSADLVRAKTGVDWSGTQLFTYDPGIGNGGTVDHREYGQAIGPYTGARCLLYALSAQLGHTNTLHSFRIYGKGVKPNFT